MKSKVLNGRRRSLLGELQVSEEVYETGRMTLEFVLCMHREGAEGVDH